MCPTQAHRLQVNWHQRHPVLEAVAVAASGKVAVSLAKRCLLEPDKKRSGIIADDVLLVKGEQLPWADGVSYLGADPQAPELLIPVYLTPDKPIALFEASLRRTLSVTTGALAVLPRESSVLELRWLQPLQHKALQAMVEQGAASDH